MTFFGLLGYPLTVYPIPPALKLTNAILGFPL